MCVYPRRRPASARALFLHSSAQGGSWERTWGVCWVSKEVSIMNVDTSGYLSPMPFAQRKGLRAIVRNRMHLVHHHQVPGCPALAAQLQGEMRRTRTHQRRDDAGMERVPCTETSCPLWPNFGRVVAHSLRARLRGGPLWLHGLKSVATSRHQRLHRHLP